MYAHELQALVPYTTRKYMNYKVFAYTGLYPVRKLLYRLPAPLLAST